MTERLAQRWTAFWNGGTATDVLSPDFRIHFGDTGPLLDPDTISGPEMMADYIATYRREFPDPVFVLDEVLPSTSGFAMRWTVTIGDQAVSGIDVAHVAEGLMTEVWSVTGSRQLPA